MNVLVIDGQGGKIGARLIELIKKEDSDINIIAVGTNSAASSAMLKSGANSAATGENSIKVACRKADFILGPVGIIAADSLLGEITADAANAVSRSDATKILIPLNRCETIVAGVSEISMTELLNDAVKKLFNMI